MPHRVVVWVPAQLPPENHRFKILLVDKLADKRGPFNDADVDLNADLAKLLLDHLGGKLAQFVPLVGDYGERKGLTVLTQDTVRVPPPACLTEELQRVLG